MKKTNYKKSTGAVLCTLDAVGAIFVDDYAHADSVAADIRNMTVRELSNLFYSSLDKAFEEEDETHEDTICYNEDYQKSNVVFTAFWDFWETVIEKCASEEMQISISPLYTFLHETTWGEYRSAVLDLAPEDDVAAETFIHFRHIEFGGYPDDKMTFAEIWASYRDPDRTMVTANYFIRPFTRPFARDNW